MSKNSPVPLPVPAPAPVPETVRDPEPDPPETPRMSRGMRERSRSLSERQPLSRAKSMEILPRGGGTPGGTSALRALFESQVMTPRERKRGGEPHNTAPVNRDTQVKLEVEDTQEADKQVEEVKKNSTHDPQPLMSEEEEVTPKLSQVSLWCSISELFCFHEIF